jgi:hypothetical protein
MTYLMQTLHCPPPPHAILGSGPNSTSKFRKPAYRCQRCQEPDELLSRMTLFRVQGEETAIFAADRCSMSL